MAAEIEGKLGLKATLQEGKGGIFEVRRDGRVVFAKSNSGRFPSPGEVAGLLGGS